MENPQDEKVEILSVVGDNPARNAAVEDDKATIAEWHSAAGGEKSWQIDRYKLTVVISIISVLTITAGIIWLASGGVEDANIAGPVPTGDLDFTQKNDPNGSIRNIPYPSVRNSLPLISPKSPSKTPSPTNSPTPTRVPDPTDTPSPTPTATPTATQTPTPTSTPTVTPEQIITPTVTP